MVKQFWSNSETRYSLLLAYVGISQQKHNKAKIANLKQTKQLKVISQKKVKMKIKFISGFEHTVSNKSKISLVYY
jgi:hypothetical protein